MALRIDHYPRLKPHYSLIAHSKDVVELRHGVWNPISYTLTDGAEDGNLLNVIALLDGNHSPKDIARSEGLPLAEVESTIDKLLEIGVVEMGPSHALDYYVDHMASTLAQQGDGAVRQPPTVLLGDPAMTEEMARLLSGVESHIELLRPDPNDPLCQWLSDADTTWLGNGLEAERLLGLFESWKGKFVILINSFMHPNRLLLWNRVSLKWRIAWLNAAIDGPFLLIGPLFVPPHTACYECLETRIMMNLRESASYQRYKRAVALGKVRLGTLPLQSVLVGLLTSHTALEALNFLLTGSSFTFSKVLSIYLPTMEFSYNEALRVPGCPACGSVPERDEKELYFDMRALLSR
jgi:bacteriocin biosynthesis cyclodehydratase domain-containing protein